MPRRLQIALPAWGLLQASANGDLERVTSLCTGLGEAARDVNELVRSTVSGRVRWGDEEEGQERKEDRRRKKSGCGVVGKVTLPGLVSLPERADACHCACSQDDMGWSPLMWAVSKQHTEVALYLIEFGAKLRLQDFDGRSAVRLFCGGGRRREEFWQETRGGKGRGSLLISGVSPLL